jgi:dTDP-4-amino-4,6-dideoxygalactose transaminase
MTEMEAAIGLVQLRKLDAFTEQRRMNAAYYDRYIAPFYERPRVAPANRHVYHQYTLRIPSADGPSRDEVRAMLERKGVATGVYYPRPLHLQPPYLELANRPCPNAERAAADMFSIPVHPAVSEDDLSRVAVELNRIASPSLNIAR